VLYNTNLYLVYGFIIIQITVLLTSFTGGQTNLSVKFFKLNLPGE